MSNIFDVQGFGALSEWNGQFSSASASQAFRTIASLGSNSVELTARIWTQTGTTDTVFADPAKTESDASLLAGFQAAHAAGLSVVFKAALSPLDGTATSSMAPTDVAAFFASYKAEIVHLATVAQAGGVQTFAIGNEMSSLTGAQYRGYWTDLISAVRQVYHGELTYAAAIDEASKVSFWDELDTIGVNTYPPLTSSENSDGAGSGPRLDRGANQPLLCGRLRVQIAGRFSPLAVEQYGKPVLMTEVGYRSIDGTAINPGAWNTSGTSDPAAQAVAYKAFFQVWTAQGGGWLKGVEFWQWDLNNQYSDTGYSVMGKPAEAVVSQYFHGDGAVPGLTIHGSAVAHVIDVGSGNNVIYTGMGNDVIRVGNGNNTIITPTTTKLTTTTITLTGWGSEISGVGAQAQILVNGKALSGVFEFKPATDPSGYQTYTVSFDNTTTGPINSVDIALLNATPGRALHVKDFSINGVALSPSDATNASSPGTFDLYVRTIHFDTTNHQDWFVGASTDNDIIDCGAGNDVIYLGVGNDTVDGGGGINTAVFQGNISDYNISYNGNHFVVSDKVANRGGTDTLTNIEYLKFADTTISTSSLAVSHSALSAGDSLQMSADSAGHITGETVRHADGSSDVYLFGIAGKDYASEHDVTNASGVTALIERFFADGDLAFRQAVNSDGSVSSAGYDAAGHLTAFATKYVDGSFDQLNFNTSGAETGETIRHADGSRDIYSYGIVGKDYTSQHTVNDASGHSVLIEDYRTDGSLTLKQTVDAGGVKTLDQYDSLGHVVQETVTQKDGSFLQSSYAPDGSLTADTARHADGTRNVDTYDITGQAYSARHDVMNASGHRVSTTFDNNDGSHTMTAYASGVTLTSTATNDVMNSAGGDTFVFKQASGQDIINNFRPGDSAGHDVIEVASSVAVDFAHLSIHVVGHDTVIDLGHDASVTLAGVIMPLTAHDVLIV